MAATRIANIIVPTVFNSYVIERTAALSALYQSGIVVANPELDALASQGGKLVNMPFWKDLSGDSEVLSDSGSLTVNNITSGQDIAVLLARGKAWGANGLAKFLSGDDPMRAIGDLVAGYWAREDQKVMLKTLEGIFGASSLSDLVSDISSGTGDAACFTGSTFIDAHQKLGDNKVKLTAIMMHSATEASLAKQGLITTMMDKDGSTLVRTFMSKRVIVDDNCPVSDSVYTSYIFGEGAIGYGVGAVETDTDKDILANDEILVNRKYYLLHPRGVKFTSSSVAGSSPTNTELATSANWERVYEVKNIRIVKFVHKLK